ncbi:MAG: divalent metal cation transporter [Bdellovibrionales bacterium]|nr:divalent metal cation transporter [Bdellovibrionales bacterium]
MLKKLGPGLITGAADDDPSGIATYSQAGALFGVNMLWTVLFTFPLMVGIQIVSARIGSTTGQGLSFNIRQHYPRWVLYSIVGLLLFANTINIAADISAMGEAAKLVLGGSGHLYAAGFGVLSLGLQVFIPYSRYVRFLKWLTLSLLAYAATLFVVRIPWLEVLTRTLLPNVTWSAEYFSFVVGVFGTTISPYLFFWQAAQEVEDRHLREHHSKPPRTAAEISQNFHRIKVDTYVGMGFSNLISYFIILTAAVALHMQGVTDIQTSADAARALRPVAGELTFILFSLGIIGTGLLAIPVLAGSSAYAIAEALDWENRSLELHPRMAKRFYSIIAVSTLIGIGLGFTSVDPIKALYISAVINGVISVPIMAVMMLMAVRPDIMGSSTIRPRLKFLGWATVFFMALAVAAMVWIYLAK